MSVLHQKMATKRNKLLRNRELRKVAMAVPASYSSPYYVVIFLRASKRYIYDYLVVVKYFVFYADKLDMSSLQAGIASEARTNMVWVMNASD